MSLSEIDLDFETWSCASCGHPYTGIVGILSKSNVEIVESICPVCQSMLVDAYGAHGAYKSEWGLLPNFYPKRIH